MNRRHWNLAWLCAATPLLGGGMAACGTPAPPTRWYRLPTEPPPGAEAPTPRAVVRSWELSPGLALPELLERDTLLVEEGAAGIRLLHGHRWAEPLRDAVPRLLRHDLALCLPGLWERPAPAGVAVAGRVQVELLALQGSLALRQVRLEARWVLTPGPAADAGATARALRAELFLPWDGAGPESLVLALRAALWQLAARIAASVEGG
jgi:uncharacterized lipoprotein YmbA